MDKMTDWITTGERPLPFFVTSFAKSASGSSSQDDDDDDDDDDEDDEDDDDPDADKSEDELRDELRKVRGSLKKANDQSARRRRRAKREREEAERNAKPKSKPTDDDKPDLDEIRSSARSEGEKAGTLRAKRSEAKAALIAAGVSPERVQRAVGMLDLDDLDLDDDGLDGIDDAIDDLKRDVPEFFARRRTKRQSVAGERDRDGERERKKPQTASEKAAAQLLRK